MSQEAKKKYQFRNFLFWAHYGKIALLDTEKVDSSMPEQDSIVWLSPKEFLERAMAVRALITEKYSGEGRRFIEDALACVKEAKEQGDISNPKILAEKMRILRPVKIFIPGAQTTAKSNIIDKLRKLRQSNADYKTVFIEGLSDAN